MKSRQNCWGDPVVLGELLGAGGSRPRTPPGSGLGCELGCVLGDGSGDVDGLTSGVAEGSSGTGFATPAVAWMAGRRTSGVATPDVTACRAGAVGASVGGAAGGSGIDVPSTIRRTPGTFVDGVLVNGHSTKAAIRTAIARASGRQAC